MLTQDDLAKIKTVVGNTFKNRFDNIDKKLVEHDAKFDQIDKKLIQHDKQFKKVQKDLKIIINYFDHNSADHETRITKIEQHLGFSKFPSL